MSTEYGKGWDIYFLNIARVVGRNSKCRSRHIGSNLVNDKCIISTGYNGPPRGVRPCENRLSESNGGMLMVDDLLTDMPWREEFTGPICPRQALGCKSGERIDLCIAAHSEDNTINQAAYKGIKTKNSILYCFCGPPCVRCTTNLINAGVKTVVCLDFPFYDHGSSVLFTQGNIELIRYSLEEVEKIGCKNYGVINQEQERVY